MKINKTQKIIIGIYVVMCAIGLFLHDPFDGYQNKYVERLYYNTIEPTLHQRDTNIVLYNTSVDYKWMALDQPLDFILYTSLLTVVCGILIFLAKGEQS